MPTMLKEAMENAKKQSQQKNIELMKSSKKKNEEVKEEEKEE